uniref:Uncharacterized protein n=1 Tax=Florenciella sp. virus SA2 TaxID=3240092 RepID=A0AB39JBJ8_9VIRU
MGKTPSVYRKSKKSKNSQTHKKLKKNKKSRNSHKKKRVLKKHKGGAAADAAQNIMNLLPENLHPNLKGKDNEVLLTGIRDLVYDHNIAIGESDIALVKLILNEYFEKYPNKSPDIAKLIDIIITHKRNLGQIIVDEALSELAPNAPNAPKKEELGGKSARR